MLVFQDHLPHLHHSDDNNSLELDVSLSLLNKSGASVSTPNSLKSFLVS